MAEALIELEQVLRTNEQKLTRQEAEVLMACKSKAIRDLTVGGLVAGSLVWIATRKLGNVFRINLAGGAAIASGMWRFGKSLDSCVDHVLTLDGSRMQNELAKIVVQRYRDDPRRMQLISRHFYPESVLDDSTLNRPKSIFRQRNVFIDHDVHNTRVYGSQAYGGSGGDKSGTAIDSLPRKEEVNSTSLRKNIMEMRRVRNPSTEVGVDPLNILFGQVEDKETSRVDNSSASARTKGHSQKRSHRRHKMRHRHKEEPLTS